MHCKEPEKTLFNDLSEAETQKWMKVLQPQPAEGWNATTTYTGWLHVPSVYVIAKQDNCIPVPFQTQMAQAAGCKVLEIDAGHMLQLSKPDEVVEIITKEAS